MPPARVALEVDDAGRTHLPRSCTEDMHPQHSNGTSSPKEAGAQCPPTAADKPGHIWGFGARGWGRWRERLTI